MASISDLNIRLGLLTKEFDRNLAKVERDLRNSGARMSRLGSDLTLAISAPLAAFGAASIKAAGDQEALTLALEQQLGSAEAARKEIELLRKEALKPGLGFEQAVRGSLSLTAVGFSAEKARETVSQFGNALALAGKGKAELDGVVLALTQISAKGKISAEEINQIAERLPQIRTLMKQAFGTADTEALQKLGITSEQFIDKITAELQKLPQATGGIKNSIENVGDAINQFLAGIGQEVNKAFDLKKVGEDIARNLGVALEWFQRLDDGTKRMIVNFGLVAIAAGPLLKVFGALYGGASQVVSIFRTVVSTSGSIAQFFASFSASTAVATSTFGSLSRAVKTGSDSVRAAQEAHKGLAHAIQIGSTAAQTAAVSVRSIGVASVASVAEAGRMKGIATQFIAPISAESARAGTAIRGLGVASVASVAEASRMKGIATQYIAPITVESTRASLAAFRLRAAILAATGGLAVVLIGIAGAVYLLSERLDTAAFTTEKFNEAQKTTIDQAARETGELNKNFDILKSVTAGTQDRQKAVNALQAAYPDYLKSIDLEKASAAELTKIQSGLNDQILRGVAERQKAAAVTAVYEKQAQILLRIQQIQRTGQTTTGENTLIDTGDMIRNGSRAAAIIEKLQAQVKDLSNQANVSAQDFDKAFGLQTRAIDPLVEQQYDARQAAEDLRSEYSALGGTLENNTRKTQAFATATAGAGDGLSKKMKTALSGVNAGLTAFDEKLKLYGPSAANAEKRNELLAASIDRLLKAGLPATSEQVQQLRGELLASTSVTDEVRKKYEALGVAAGNSADSTRELSAATNSGIGSGVQKEIAEVTANLAAFDAQVKQYAPSAENAEKRNELLAKSIDRLLKAGFSATSTQVQTLKDELDKSTTVTDAAKEAYRKLREEWSKPVNIDIKQTVPTLPQANPLGVGDQQQGLAQPEPLEIVSVGALNEGLVAINALTLGLQNLTTLGLTPAQAIMQGIKNDTLLFSEAYALMAENVMATGPAIQQIALGIGESFNAAANSGAASFSEFAREFIKSAAKIIRTQIQIAVTNAALSALQSTPYPYNLILAGVAGAAAGALFQGIVNKITAPKLAAGGVITKPTFAMLGEYPGASSNPEIAAPESKLRSIFRSENGGGGPTELYSVVRGDDILLVSDKAATRRGRVR